MPSKRRRNGPGTMKQYEAWAKRRLAAQRRAAKVKAKANPSHIAAKVTGWVRAKAVKIVRNKRGQATAVKIKT